VPTGLSVRRSIVRAFGEQVICCGGREWAGRLGQRWPATWSGGVGFSGCGQYGTSRSGHVSARREVRPSTRCRAHASVGPSPRPRAFSLPGCPVGGTGPELVSADEPYGRCGSPRRPGVGPRTIHRPSSRVRTAGIGAHQRARTGWATVYRNRHRNGSAAEVSAGQRCHAQARVRPVAVRVLPRPRWRCAHGIACTVHAFGVVIERQAGRHTGGTVPAAQFLAAALAPCDVAFRILPTVVTARDPMLPLCTDKIGCK